MNKIKMSIQKFNPKMLKFEFDLSNAKYVTDSLQERLLEFYIRADSRFRRAFHTNYTMDFIQYLKDKAVLREPVHLSIMGSTRGGKSSIASTIGFIMMALYGKQFSVDYICGDSIEFLEKIKIMPEEMTKNSYFQMDEQKNLFGIGSMAKKIKLQDVANIIAKHNISTASLCPTKFANQEASYGLRIFGKCYNTKTCRLMLYNLQEGRNSLPLGNVYLPIPSAILPSELAKKFTDEYEAKKDRWIQKEMMGEGDALAELKRKSAESFMRDKQFLELKKKNEKIVYISMKLGTDWTKMEIDEIYHITQMLEKGIVFKE